MFSYIHIGKANGHIHRLIHMQTMPPIAVRIIRVHVHPLQMARPRPSVDVIVVMLPPIICDHWHLAQCMVPAK